MTRPADARPSFSHFRRVDGLIRHARVYPGPTPSTRPIVIVPGLGCASWMYRRLARRLAAEREVWVYDHPGMGLSQGRPCDPVRIEELTDHLAAWMQARGLVGVPLLGHSLGGEVVIDLAARFPRLPGCLVLCSPTGIPENPSVSAQLVRFLLNMPRERLALYPLALVAYLRTGPRAYPLAQDQDRHQTGPLISRVRCPALVIDGSRDSVIRSWTLEVMCDLLPRARARTIEGGTHALMDSRPDEAAGETLAFLRDVDSGHFIGEK
ncbi:alpha/beta fold hydrolase [Deinococcus sp.]|uniref:alpha/beta fold hydrolase n=1 Tax=Deinococcus sp. TaxID=47478 RepID=UPI003C7BA3F3